MSDRNDPSVPIATVARRQFLVGMAVALGSLAAGYKVSTKPQQEATKPQPNTVANQQRTSLHQETDLRATPKRIYELLLDSKQFAAFTGVPAEIDPKAGGAFSLFGGLIVGRNVELVPNERIVQAWRPSHWDPGIYSVVGFDLKPRGSETRVVLNHTGFPEGDFDHLSSGWSEHYWEPLKKYLA